ncbi:hypothetical protein L6452_02689 [Arctium lappa]|uniref:Uncharacterized protein n=1 Tax=Arctium lappa TaxID=4217 RepID=A0ACB9FJR7_ARCLA|nr:hypothetical protein L6452_02689 [Arctium lappa]
MLDGLLGRGGFSSKCKSLIKPTRTRIEVLRRRAEAKQRFLKEDLAKLLANGLDVNAYGRTEEFIAGLNLLSCYTFIDQSCEYILKQLSVMQKLGQCPEEFRETVASLMFAAARFSDLPELRDLRDVFQERYGSGLECFVNQVFVEKLASKPPAVEKRIKLLQDIAAEFSIQWDSKGFKERMDKPSTLAQDQAKKLGPLSVADDKYKLPNGNNVFRKNDQRSKERIEHAHKEAALHNGGNVIVRNIPFVGREEKCSKERIEHAHKEAPSHNDGNVNVWNIPFVGREEKRPKERIEHAHKEHTLHNDGNVIFRNIPFVGREEKRPKERIEHAHKEPALPDDGNVHVRRKELLDIPIVGRDEKRGYKHEVLISKAENDGYFSKAKQESASEKNGFGKNDTPSSLKSSGSSYHDRKPEGFDDAKVNRGRKERHGYKQEPVTNRAETIETENDDDRLFKGRQEFAAKKHGSSIGADPTHFMIKSPRSSRDRRPEIRNNDRVNGDEDIGVKLTRKVQVEEVVRLKSCYNGSLPPPYVKSNIPPPYSKPINADKIHKKQDSPYHEHGARDDLSPHIVSNSDHGVGNDVPLPKPRSIRRKHSKSSSSHDDVGSSEDARIVKRISSSRRKERKGLQILFDDEHYHKDEEEKMMDKLLLHYSKKPSAYDVGKLRKKKSRSNTSKSPHHRSMDEAEIIVPPTRSISLPHEQSGESESKKVYARANSFQPDNQAPHVHPKLPDYDDLAARFAALRGG